GIIQAANGGKLGLSGQTNLTNYAAASNTLTGGTWKVRAGSALNFPAAVSVHTNAADVTLDGGGSNFPALGALTTNAGRLTLSGGRSFAASPPGGTFINSGSLLIGPGSTLAVSGGFSQSPGGTLTTEIAGPN